MDRVSNTTVYATGASRSADGEDERFELISPIGLKRLAKTYAEGAEKRGRANWEKGMAISDCINRTIRHCYEYLSGDRSEDHLAHAAWGLFASMHSEAMWPELNRGMLRSPGCVAPGTPDYKDPVDEGEYHESVKNQVNMRMMEEIHPALESSGFSIC